MTLPRWRLVTWRAALLAAVASLLAGSALTRLLASQHAATTPAPAAAAGPGGLWSLPLDARGPVSGAVGETDGSYRVSSTGGQLRAANPGQGLSMLFNRTGVTLGTGAGQVAVTLAGLGAGDALNPVAPAEPRAAGNRVVYRHAGLVEWYANGPLGLEQGFTVSRPPAGATGPLTLSLAVSGAARLSLSRTAQAVTLARAGGAPPLSYGALHATDANGTVLGSWMQVRGGHVLLRVDTRTARYPISIDPLVGPGPEAALLASDETGEARLGYSVALSADGNTALVGGPRDGEHFGAAWVFVRAGGTWVQEGPKLTGGEQTGGGSGQHCGDEPGEEKDGCGFGRSVALSADGNTALVGNPRDTVFEPGSEGEPGEWVANGGAVWVFTRSAGIWSQQGPKLTPADEAGEGRFGKSVALSDDGATALIGGSSDAVGHGAAWVFTRSGGAWSQQGKKLTGVAVQGEAHLGGSVALSGDGGTALVGGPGDNGFTGAAWVFTHSGSSWSQQKLTGTNATQQEAHFGYSVALSSDGTTALVGGRHDGEGRGAAWTFTSSGGGWSELGSKLAGTGEGEEFGYSVALSADGHTALIGGARNSASRGTALLVQRSGESWSGPSRQLHAGAFAAGRPWFGASVALSSDAQTAVVGGPNDHARTGAAWVFGPRPGVEGVSPGKGAANGGTAVTIHGSNLEEATGVWFGATQAQSFSANADGTITAVSPPGSGVVDVTVTNAFGTSPTNTKDKFEYLTPQGAPPGVPGGGSGGDSGSRSDGVLGAGPSSGVLGAGPTRACSASLLSRRITVLSRGRAAVKLLWRGAGSCRGKLRLRVKVRAGKRVKTKTIGTATFLLAHGKARTITIKLNTSGRALLGKGGGRLGANLLIANLPAGTAPARTANVRLTLQKPRPAKLVRK